MRPSAVRTLQTWRLEQCSGEEVRGAVRPAELPRLGGAAPAGGPSGGEEQSRRVQARRSRAGTGGAGRGEGRGDLQLAPSGTRSFQAASRGRRSRFFSPPYPFGSIWVAPSASAREIERARAAGPNFSRESAPLPPRRRLARLRAASAPPNRRLAPPSSASRPDCRLPP